jgi:hypothetical protein
VPSSVFRSSLSYCPSGSFNRFPRVSRLRLSMVRSHLVLVPKTTRSLAGGVLRLEYREDWQCCILLTLGLDRVARILTRRGAQSDRVVLVVDAGVCALPVQGRAAWCAVPCVDRCTSVHRSGPVVGGCVRCIVDFGQLTVLWIQVHDVAQIV